MVHLTVNRSKTVCFTGYLNWQEATPGWIEEFITKLNVVKGTLLAEGYNIFLFYDWGMFDKLVTSIFNKPRNKEDFTVIIVLRESTKYESIEPDNYSDIYLNYTEEDVFFDSEEAFNHHVWEYCSLMVTNLPHHKDKLPPHITLRTFKNIQDR